MEHILIVEDEPKIADLLQKYLQNANYHTHWLNTGLGVGEWVRQTQPNLILLDLMLPGKDGLEVCKEIRQFSPIPIIMLTARAEEIDRLLGLELGADDYICKPFSPREVVARVKAVLRRVPLIAADQTQHPPSPNARLLELDRDRLLVRAGEHEALLTLVEFELLATLKQQPGRIFGRDQLMTKVYTDNRIVSDRTIDSHIKKLRKKLSEILPDQELIHSVYSVGYKFEA
ncbi:two-component system, OmpR family, response regulator BaeR [Thiothrix caldifontis]|uniref:Two-component system, OmpR family, response regulator BaeR n=1 Tax=Thiothrix caldifontis TaxID=525918 RepID=A0A1H4E7Q9_9GAMM|nr:response regulator [Thiothrix caldifontis]SEA81114.1 two-component system, OmpR family, response regulator BaeR [Thiothrix caldifontis]